jgi:arylsulfatase A-like enzyme
MKINDTNKNVVFLVLDSLRADRIGSGDNNSSITPFIDELARNGLVYKNVFSCGNNTEFAMSALLSSSYLLDNGGYFSGINNRDDTLAEIFEANGYCTAAFLPCYMRSISGGFSRGFKDYFFIFDFNLFLKEINNTVPWYQKMFLKELMTEAECVDALIKYFNIYFKDVIEYCQIWLSYPENPCIPKSSILKHYNYGQIKKDVEEEYNLYCNDKYLYISRIIKGDIIGFDYGKGVLCGAPCGLIDIINNAVRGRLKRSSVDITELKYRAILAWNLPWMWYLSSSRGSAKQVCVDAFYRVLNGHQHWVKYVSAGYVLQTFKNWIDSNGSKFPFYTYIHCVDAHELNPFSYDLYGAKEKKTYELDNFKHSLSRLKHSRRTYRGNLLYDSSISYLDCVVKDLYRFLEQKGLLSNSIIIITADHGHAYPNIPIRDGVSLQEHFFDDLSHVPLIINGSGIPQGQNEDLVSTLDIGPSILDLLDIPIPESFKGISVKPGSYAKREYVINENQGRGPCDMARKPLRICVRNKEYKLVYECAPEVMERQGDITELYDLVSDPEEVINLADESNKKLPALSLLEVAIERVRTIRRYMNNESS